MLTRLIIIYFFIRLHFKLLMGMSKQDRQDWFLSIIAWSVIVITIVGNYYIHGGRLAW
jgi:heme/copper-type cytochrome/quinol oxidase subunit 4